MPAAWRFFISEAFGRLPPGGGGGIIKAEKQLRRSVFHVPKTSTIPQGPLPGLPPRSLRRCVHLPGLRLAGGTAGRRDPAPQSLPPLPFQRPSGRRAGDRASDCGGTMEPVAVWVRRGGEWAVIHRCRVCGVLHSNRTAADDNPALLLSLAVKPLAAAFPAEPPGGADRSLTRRKSVPSDEESTLFDCL